jgi:hypothetical protein
MKENEIEVKREWVKRSAIGPELSTSTRAEIADFRLGIAESHESESRNNEAPPQTRSAEDDLHG